jgi:predicted cupin superfamily sugar epimerase
MSAWDALSAEDVARLLDLSPHPEGGYYRETFRDSRQRDGRAVSTAIYYLLPAGQVSAWHRVDAAEIWHYHAGAPLELSLWDEGRRLVLRLGADLLGGERPQGIAPAGVWQSARSLGAWTLVGCTVAPGLEFAHFEMAPPGFPAVD